MSGLFGSLANGVKALNAQSRAVEIAGKNLANVNNTSYARQRVVFGDRGTVMTTLGAQSLGLEAKSISQVRDNLLDRQVVREIGITADFTAEQRALQNAQAALGQSIDRTDDSDTSASSGSGGIMESVASFFGAFESLAARPTDAGERQSLLQDAEILTDRLRLTDTRLSQVQADLGTQVSADVADANVMLTTIAELNSQIGRFEINAPGSAVDLRDQRQKLLEDLSSKIAIETRPNATEAGQLDVFVRDGSNAEVTLVSLASVVSTLSFNGTNVQAGTPAANVALTGGSMRGALTARDGAIQTLRDQLDDFTAQLVTAVNDAYNPTGTTGDFFVATGLTAGTIRVTPGLTATTLKASDGGAAGDNSVALAVAGLITERFSVLGGDSFDGTFTQHLANAVSGLGQSLSSVNSRLSDQTNIESLVRGQRDSVSGVSLDEEMADLMKFQRAYQASSRVINVIDDLLDTLVNRTGV